MRKNIIFLCLLLFVVGIVVSIFGITHAKFFAVINPQGLIALQERNLIVTAMTIMLSVAIPVVLAMFFVAWKYSANNSKTTYSPDEKGSNAVKIIWWSILVCLVVIFSSIVWVAAHRLDPYKSLNSSQKPIIIQVVALQWKWLFIYPQEHIATVNFIQFPVHTPVEFDLTADAPMNSFWIPNLGGQIYAMATMQTKLHLLSDTIGDFPGGAAEINGAGFSGMRFIARVSTQKDFDTWVKNVKKNIKPLNKTTYTQLAKPSENTPVTSYFPVDNALYNAIMIKDLKPTLTLKH